MYIQVVKCIMVSSILHFKVFKVHEVISLNLLLDQSRLETKTSGKLCADILSGRIWGIKHNYLQIISNMTFSLIQTLEVKRGNS